MLCSPNDLIQLLYITLYDNLIWMRLALRDIQSCPRDNYTCRHELCCAKHFIAGLCTMLIRLKDKVGVLAVCAISGTRLNIASIVVVVDDICFEFDLLF